MPKRACLHYHIGQCYAPCTGAIGKDAYSGIVRQLKLFLSGRRKELIENLSGGMRKAATAKDYEKAAVLRDRITALSVVPGMRVRTGAKPYDEIMALRHLLGLKRLPRRMSSSPARRF